MYPDYSEIIIIGLDLLDHTVAKERPISHFSPFWVISKKLLKVRHFYTICIFYTYETLQANLSALPGKLPSPKVWKFQHQNYKSFLHKTLKLFLSPSFTISISLSLILILKPSLSLFLNPSLSLSQSLSLFLTPSLSLSKPSRSNIILSFIKGPSATVAVTVVVVVSHIDRHWC